MPAGNPSRETSRVKQLVKYILRFYIHRDTHTHREKGGHKNARDNIVMINYVNDTGFESRSIMPTPSGHSWYADKEGHTH